MTIHHFPKTHCSNDDVILSNNDGHQNPPLATYEVVSQFIIAQLLDPLLWSTQGVPEDPVSSSANFCEEKGFGQVGK